jgi:uncharacterized protein (DUF58 family)
MLTIGSGLAAINSGNNMLYLVLALLMSLIVVSAILTELNLRRLSATRGAPVRLVAGEPALVRVQVTNHKRRMASLSIEVEELVPRDSPVQQRSGYLLQLRPGETRAVFVRLDPAQRGVAHSAGIAISTAYPFGFVRKRRLFLEPARYLVRPRQLAETHALLPAVARGAEEVRRGRGTGDEFHGLRDYRAGEDARGIAWKASARRGKLVIREHEAPATRRVVVRVLNAIPSGEATATQEVEGAIARAAALAEQYADSGFAVGLATADGGFPPEGGPAALARLRDHLAAVPVREVTPGIPVALFARYDATLVEEVTVSTAAQRKAGLIDEVGFPVRLGAEAAAG